ncbi:MAG: glycoside hydrolase domain-containing protein, partial [Polyangia bacterium]
MDTTQRNFIAALSLAVVGAGCTGAPEMIDETESAFTARKGVDYSFARPSPSGLHNEGYTFAARYFSYDNSGTHGKILFAGEANALIAAGVDVVSNWEYGATDALGGYNSGVNDAKAAAAQAAAAGAPADRPIYFSVDFDATPADQTPINAYMDGVASVIGRARTGAYGGYYVIKRAFDAGKITWGWQTYAWSGGQWDPRAQLRQVQNGITAAGDGNCCDLDQSAADDFGQWHHSAPWGAKYVSQSWPLASASFTLKCGEALKANIVLRNVGSHGWDGNTRLGTTQPRDRASRFVGADWLAANRPSHVNGTVAPNGTAQFNFTFQGPTGAACVPGQYHEFFGVVQEGVAWFSDAGQGGPADNDIEAWINLVPGA